MPRYILSLIFILIGLAASAGPEEVFTAPPGVFRFEFHGPGGEQGVSESILFPLAGSQPSGAIMNTIQTHAPGTAFDILTAESTLGDARALQAQLRNAGYPVQVIVIPKEVYEAWESPIRAVAIPVDVSETPNQKEVILGVTTTTYRTAIGLNWFSMGLPTSVAASIVATQAIFSLVNGIGIRGLDRVFRSPIIGSDERVSVINEIIRREIYIGLFTEFIRFLSGPVGKAHAINTWEGQGEIFAIMVASGLGSAIFSSVRNKVFSSEETKFAMKWMQFDMAFPSTIFRFLAMAGIPMVSLCTIGYIDVNLATLGLLGVHLIGAALMKGLPNQTLSFARRQERFLDASIKNVKSISSRLSCESVFRRSSH